MKNIEMFCKDYGIAINASKSQAIIISSKNNVHNLNYDTLSKISINGDEIIYMLKMFVTWVFNSTEP